MADSRWRVFAGLILVAFVVAAFWSLSTSNPDPSGSSLHGDPSEGPVASMCSLSLCLKDEHMPKMLLLALSLLAIAGHPPPLSRSTTRSRFPLEARSVRSPTRPTNPSLFRSRRLAPTESSSSLWSNSFCRTFTGDSERSAVRRRTVPRRVDFLHPGRALAAFRGCASVALDSCALVGRLFLRMAPWTMATVERLLSPSARSAWAVASRRRWVPRRALATVCAPHV